MRSNPLIWLLIPVLAAISLVTCTSGSDEEKTIENPPADASSISLSLVEVVNKEPVAIKTIFIGPERVECEGEGPQLCYQYKENPTGDWLLYYNEIEGFDYEEGFNYELIVAETRVENPPAGGSTTQLTLVEEVNKSKLPPSLIGTIWATETINGQPVIEGNQVVMGISEGRIGGFAGCNTYFGPYEATGNQVTVGPLASTRLACSEDIMGQESDYLEALHSAASYQIVDEKLQVANANAETILTFSIVEPAPLEGTQWELTTYNNGQQAMTSVLPGTRITALFESGTVSGSAGCNNYNASYELDGKSITIGPGASTMMACPEPEGVMEQEQLYLAALQSAGSYQIIANRLELISESGELAAMFTVAEPTTLENINWNVIGYNNGREAVVSVIIGSEITLLFEEGTVSGLASCNNYNAPYELASENSIKIGQAVTTRKSCPEPEGIMEQEIEFLAALQSVVEYRIDGDRLDMFTADGARALNAVAAGAGTP